MNMKDRFKSVHTRDPKEVLAQQTRILEATLDRLIDRHVEKTITCDLLLVGQLFKDLVTFSFRGEEDDLGTWRGVAVTFCPAMLDICAIAITVHPRVVTSTEDPGF